MKRVRTAIIGCGEISHIYLKNLTGPFSKWVDVVACSDLRMEQAELRAKEFNVPKAMDPENVYKDDSIELIVCLTDTPTHHFVCKNALQNNKHVYVEKTLGINLEEGRELLQLAKENNLYLAGAPDTFLGAGFQTARRLIDDGWIGKPIAAVASMRRRVNAPAPNWLWKKGAGPLFDMGPYYITALLSILGSVDSVVGLNQISYPERSIYTLDGRVEMAQVEVPTNVNGMLRFKNGVDALLTTSFDVWDSQRENHVEINGTDGSIILPDPNFFGGPIYFYGKNMDGPKEIPLIHDFSENSRGLGVADMARAIRLGTCARADSVMGYHMLEIAVRIIESGEAGKFLKVESGIDMPLPMPVDSMNELCVDSSLK